jgi:hypothetical protein
MPVKCAHCGEDLIGNVNRCWRCGNNVVSTCDSGVAPPVRRGKVNLERPVPVAYLVPEESSPGAAEGADGKVTTDDEVSRSSGESSKRADQSTSKPSFSPVPVRHGSPFRDGVYAASDGARLPGDVVMPSYPDSVLRENLAVASVVVGIMSLFGTAITEWAVIPAAVGLALAVLGLKSDRRRLAKLGIIIACVAIFFATWKTIIAVRTYLDLQNQMRMDESIDYF